MRCKPHADLEDGVQTTQLSRHDRGKQRAQVATAGHFLQSFVTTSVSMVHASLSTSWLCLSAQAARGRGSCKRGKWKEKSEISRSTF